MNILVNKLITIIKKEEFVLDDSIPFSYLFSFILKKLFFYLKSILIFKSIKIAFVGRRSKVLASRLIRFENNLSIADDCYIDALSIDGVSFGNNVSINKRVVIECTGSMKSLGRGLSVGNNVGIGSNSFLGCAGGIEIGDDTIIGNFVSFHSENHVFDRLDKPIRLQGVSQKGIKVGRDCWIGAKATILDGTILGDGCIVAAGSVLNGKSYPNHSVIAGVPATVIKTRR